MNTGVNGKVNGAAAVPVAVPVAAPAAAAPGMDPETDLGQVLSPTQANTFLDCPAKWYFRYRVGLPDPKSGALAIGTAVDAAIAASMRYKVETGKDLEIDCVTDAFDETWAGQMEAAELRDDEDADELGALGQSLVELYMREAAPAIHPRLVQHPVAGEIGGVAVRGFIDLVDVEGRVIDLKTAARRPSGVTPDHRLQLTTYDLLLPDSRGQARVDTLIKTQVVKLHQQSLEIGPSDVQYAEAIYPAVQDAIRDGVYYPRRTSHLCSRKYCAFWRACEKEFGGEVAS